MIDLDSLDVSDDGDVDGLDSQIDAIKDELPELFAPKVDPNVKAKPARIDAGNKPAPDKKQSAADRIANMLTSSRSG
jgi:hypothetical protein